MAGVDAVEHAEGCDESKSRGQRIDAINQLQRGDPSYASRA
jgi:hypothetical protein